MNIRVILTLITPIIFSDHLHAQAPGVPIFEQSQTAIRQEDNALGKTAEQLMKKGAIVTHETVQPAMQNPEKISFLLKKRSEKKLEASEIAKHALKSTYRIGWVYLCKNCDRWHTNLGGGYAVSDDGILATCTHVINPDGMNLLKGCLIAIDHQGEIFPVTKIIAYHKEMDAALLKIETNTMGLAFNDQVHPGNEAFCLSRPLKQGKYFSKGIVNRFFWNSTKRGSDDSDLKALAHLRLNVSSRWAPGSSGSPVFDHFGNIIGHVSTIKSLGGDKDKPSQITLHTAVPARSVMTLSKN
ncbi:serine protease [Akkermansiaceae bacterium]|nr:serine protease [Akkermansiaceae bacterium]